MRQLAASGWMHNRVRMIVASFLVKDLLVDWRLGEGHFRRLLVDGGTIQNVGNWQWVAGTGPDAAPYFRVFNPTTQAEKFDPRDYMKPAREAMAQVVKERMIAFGQAGWADKVPNIGLDEMARRYRS